MSAAASILSIAATALGLLARLLRRPSARAVLAKKVHGARAASACGDVDEVNRRTELHRVRRRSGGALLLLCAVLPLLAGCGCRSLRWPGGVDAEAVPRVVVVSADRWQYPMTNEAGVAGWFVPVAVHAEMMEAIELLEAYTEKRKASNP